MNDTIGNRMLTLRVEHEITRVTLAKELGLTTNTIYRIEIKGDAPHIYTVMAYAEYFGVSTDWILFGKKHER